jgi:hypothetical protein
MYEEMRHLNGNVTMNASVVNVSNRTQRTEDLQNGASALRVVRGAKTFALDCAVFVCVTIATPMTTLMTSQRNTEVTVVTKTVLGTYLTLIATHVT